MEDVSPRLMEHVCRFRDVPHPVVGFGICTHEFNGISWAEDNGVEGAYLDLWVGNLLVNVRRDDEEAQGWHFGLLVNGGEGVVSGWYPPSMVTPIPRRHFRSVDNLLDSLVMTYLP